MFVYLLLS